MERRVAIVTGASSGIGEAAARLLSAAGFQVFGTSRTPRAQETALRPLDVRDDAAVSELVRTVLAEAGRIDVLVNNAGYSQGGAIEENSVVDAQAQFDTNVFGMLRMAKAVLPAMRRAGGGRIINVSSVLGHVAPAYAGIYAGSKFALEGLSEALAAEVRPFGVFVSLIEPAFVRTRFEGRPPAEPVADYDARRRVGAAFARAGVGHGMDPRVAAAAIVRAATDRRPRLRYQVGGTSRVLILLKRLLPESAFLRVRQKAFPAESPRLAGARPS